MDFRFCHRMFLAVNKVNASLSSKAYSVLPTCAVKHHKIDNPNLTCMSKQSLLYYKTSCRNLQNLCYSPNLRLLPEKAYLNSRHLLNSISNPKSRHMSSDPDNKGAVDKPGNPEPASTKPEPRENIYTIPNYLTVGRFFISPFLGYMVLQEQFAIVCGLFVVAGLTDLLDGYIARNWKGQASILGSVIDPLADKFLVTILCLSLTAVHLIPVWLAALILSRDVYLVLTGFRVRWVTLSPPKTFKRYFDFGQPTASVQPSLISKVNTNVQLLLLTTTCAAPIFGYINHVGLHMLWGLTAVTTSWSFYDYVTKAPYTVLKK